MKIFVFGSNLAGVHGAGAARWAFKNRGALRGQGVGRAGDSYAIPTKDFMIETLPKDSVRYYIDMFVEYARIHPELEFQVTRVGCGLAGFTDAEIAPLFSNAGKNCSFDTIWKPWLPDRKFWGSF